MEKFLEKWAYLVVRCTARNKIFTIKIYMLEDSNLKI